MSGRMRRRLRSQLPQLRINLIGFALLLIMISCILSDFRVLSEGASGFCQERLRLVAGAKGDIYRALDITNLGEINLPCRYCDEPDDGKAKNWFKIDHIGLGTAHPIPLGMDNNLTRNKFSINEDHSLKILNFSEADRGYYSCTGLESESEAKFDYLIDIIFEVNTTDYEGKNITNWSNYHDEYFIHLNNLFATSRESEFVYIRDQLQIEMELITEWQNWGKCEVCGRPRGEGIRKKIGLCKIKLFNRNTSGTVNNEDEAYLVKASSISCRSERLINILPILSNKTKQIPNFALIEKCEGICNPASEENIGWKSSKGFKYRKTLVMNEGSHLILVCPESTLDNIVVWKKQNKVLNPGKSNHLIVDSFNTLYLIEVTQNEAGNYTCEVDEIKMQQVIIFIVPTSKFLTQIFVRHLIYLSFVLSLTLVCYLGGIVIAWSKRHKFKSYEELREKALKKNDWEALFE